jgi:hypothetical protein
MRNRIYMSSSSDRIPIGNKAPNGYILYRNIIRLLASLASFPLGLTFLFLFYSFFNSLSCKYANFNIIGGSSCWDGVSSLASSSSLWITMVKRR